MFRNVCLRPKADRMKQSTLSTPCRPHWPLMLAVFTVLSLVTVRAPQVRADSITLGSAGQFAMFADVMLVRVLPNAEQNATTAGTQVTALTPIQTVSNFNGQTIPETINWTLLDSVLYARAFDFFNSPTAISGMSAQAPIGAGRFFVGVPDVPALIPEPSTLLLLGVGLLGLALDARFTSKHK